MSAAQWRTHDWSHGLPIVRQAFVVFRPGYAIHSVFFPASSVRRIAFRPCLTQTLCQRVWLVLPVTVLTVISEESVCRFVCYSETGNLYPFVLKHLCPNLIYILLSIDIAVMPGSALRAYPFPDTQILNICVFIPAAAADLWWWIPSADFSEIFTGTLHFILYHC